MGKKIPTDTSLSKSFCNLQGIVQQILNVQGPILTCTRQRKETLRQVPEWMSLLCGHVFFCHQFLQVVQGFSQRIYISLAGLQEEHKLVKKILFL